MDGGILALIIVSPIASCIGLYQCFNYGRLPCINTSNIDNLNKVVAEQ
jgi:hypothetical protein